jgi:hypothetical protein
LAWENNRPRIFWDFRQNPLLNHFHWCKPYVFSNAFLRFSRYASSYTRLSRCFCRLKRYSFIWFLYESVRYCYFLFNSCSSLYKQTKNFNNVMFLRWIPSHSIPYARIGPPPSEPSWFQ